MNFEHRPVLLEECIEGLNIHPEGIYVDCTLGGGGHSERIAERLASGRLVGLDRDGDAIAAASERLSRFGNKVSFCKTNFSELGEALDSLGIRTADGFLFDLGVSSYQLDAAERGFSYSADAPLDMRMDRSSGITAAELLEGIEYGALVRILRDYGEEKFAPQIASAIIRARQLSPIETTTDLKDIIASALPAAARAREKQHPAKRSFQAIRIAVNSELDSVRAGVAAAIDRLAPGGRICVISFHSLEDRIIKNLFAENAVKCTCPRDFPVCVCGANPKLGIITKHPIIPNEDELSENPRSHSAKLRIAERI